MNVPAAVYARDGYQVRPALAGPDLVESTLGDVDALRARFGLEEGTGVLAAPPGWPHAARLAADPAVVGAARDVLGGPGRCFGVSYLVKPAGRGLPARWHQDIGPWAARLGGAAAVTVWLALTDADLSAGCLQVLAGSQRGPVHQLVPDGADRSLFGVGVAAGVVDPREAVTVEVTAGDAVLLDPAVLHASGPNRSTRPRVAAALRFHAAPSR